MPVYTGQSGFIELRRTSGHYVRSSLAPSAVNTARKRFGVENLLGSIVTGDKIVIKSADGSTALGLISGHTGVEWAGYAAVDDLGGCRLYATFPHAVAGGATNALTLTAPSSTKDILITTVDTSFRPLGRLTSFNFTTNREQIQIDILGDQFRQMFDAGRIQGQGSLECEWEHRYVSTDPGFTYNQEFSVYLARLLMRLNQGSDFFGRFFMYRESGGSSNNVWYEANAQITNCGVAVRNREIIKTQIDFITNGQFELQVGATPGYVLQENTDYLLQESGDKIFLEDDAT
tara:strand:+ start:1688 stop:2554 length:867 start_codon:yes stop_codon:yes gene_type:complete